MSDLSSPTIIIDPTAVAKNAIARNEAFTLLTEAATKLDEGDGESDLMPQRLRTLAAVVKVAQDMGGLATFVQESTRLGLYYDETLSTAATRLDALWGDEKAPELAAGLRELDGKLTALAITRS